MRLFFLLLLLTLLRGIAQAQSAVPQSTTSAETATRPVLLVFSGSDWCQPCIRFEKQVLSDSVFLAYAAQYLEVVKADFPQKKKLSPEQRRENEQLAEQYNPKGKFPHLVLLRPDRSVLAVLPSDAENGPAFIAQVKNYLPQ